MDESIFVALIVAVVAPAVMAWITGYQRRKEKREDWARQDAVADRLVQHQREVAAHVAEVVTEARTANETAAAMAETTNIKLDKITSYVDGAVTETKREALAGVRRELLLLHASAVTEAVRAAIKAAEQRVSDLETEIAAREETDRAAKAAEAVARLKTVVAEEKGG